MRIYLVLLSILIAGGLIWVTKDKQEKTFGGVTLTERVNQIKDEQAIYKQANGKYKQYSLINVGSAVVSVDEYVSPSGAGYQINLIEKTPTSTIFKTIGFGPEAESRTHTIIRPETATSTPL